MERPDTPKVPITCPDLATWRKHALLCERVAGGASV